ncbi:MAG: hypothetical protein K2L11_11975 [Muribaculaceae bacterium]|nr:hypothetical protein [Muribaculaceae bacterium]
MGKKNNKIIWLIIGLTISLTLALNIFHISTFFESQSSKEYEILEDTLYIKTSLTNGLFRVYVSKDGNSWKNYIEFEEERIRNHISNMYFFPPDTLYVLNVEGETVSGIKSIDFKIIDVMSEEILVLKDNEWIAAERLRYEVDDKYIERFCPGSARIAYRLTYDSIMCSSPLWISLEPNLNGFTTCDSTGHAIKIYY